MKKQTAAFIAAALLLTLCGCGNRAAAPTEPPAEPPAEPSATVAGPVQEPEDAPIKTEEPGPGETPSTPEPPAVSAPPSVPPSAPLSSPPSVPPSAPPQDKEPELLRVDTAEAIRDELENAIKELRQPAAMELSGVTLSERPELDVKNLYYDLLAENRALCYAYELTASVSGYVLTAEIAYMPYVTGQYPDGFSGVSVASTAELIALAEESLGAEPVNIRITDSQLTPDDMNRALQQAGGGYIICSLDRAATALTFAPAAGFSMEDCLTYISECEALAQGVADTLISDGMDDAEKAGALYGYLTENVKYDQRYYSDRAGMPYHSQTAYGALHDGVAICGGYSHALKLLFEKAGVACYNVSGKWGREYHMWSLARIDGEWLYFDATGDRGVSPEGWKYFGVEADALTGHSFGPQGELPPAASGGGCRPGCKRG